MRSLIRPVLLVVLLLGLVTAAYGGWLAWQVRGDLASARDSSERLRHALEDGDRAEARASADDLARSAAAARSRTDSIAWDALTVVPMVGDDAEGVATVSAVLDDLSSDGVGPLLDVVEQLEGLTHDGRVDLGVVRSLREPVARGADAFEAADTDLDRGDPDDYVGPLATSYTDLGEQVDALAHGLGSARTALDVLPGMVGAEGPRDYLLVLQSNAEVRATGGLPGAWAVVHAESGRLTIGQQGAAADFGGLRRPVLPLSTAERKVFGPQLGTYFQDANMTSDFPRAADLWAARWEGEAGARLDGVVAVDTVALSYLLAGTGSVGVEEATLTAENAVEILLSRVYREIPEPEAQDAAFRAVTRAVLDAITRRPASPVDLARGLGRAADEGRLLVRSFDMGEQEALSGTRVAGELAADDGATPHVDVTLNDATGAKMSYYLRRAATVDSISCDDGRQVFAGTLTLASTVTRAEVRDLPDYVTGGGRFGTDPGSQLVLVRLHAPYDGSIGTIRVGDRRVEPDVVDLDGRPVATVVALLAPGRELDVTWEMTGAAGQTGDAELRVTPGVVPGTDDATLPSAC